MQKKKIISILERTRGFVDCTDNQQVEICSLALSDLQEIFRALSKSWGVHISGLCCIYSLIFT